MSDNYSGFARPSGSGGPPEGWEVPGPYGDPSRGTPLPPGVGTPQWGGPPPNPWGAGPGLPNTASWGSPSGSPNTASWGSPGLGSGYSPSQPHAPQPQYRSYPTPPPLQNVTGMAPLADLAATGRAESRAVAALVLGIVSVVTCWIPFLYLASSLAGGIVAIVLGTGVRRNATAGLPVGVGAATAGFVLGIIGTALATLNLISGALGY